jgi:transposase
MRKVFLEELPHGGTRFVSENRVNWKESVGKKLQFIYDEIEGYFEIIDYDNSKYRITIIYDGKIFNRHVGAFIECKIASIVGKMLKTYKYNVDDIVEVKSGKIKIIKHIKIPNGKKGVVRGYSYQCLNCNHQTHITEGHLKEKLGCPVCMGQKVKVGLNDMWTTNPSLAKLLANPEDGYKYMQNSNLKVNWKCPECGNVIKNKQPSQINVSGISCHKCSDKISYPEKITYNFLSQLNVEFETQKVFYWSDNKRYDFYVSNLDLIIEVHGKQHYEESKRGRSLEEEQENDRLKEKLARENGIDKYIVIDCRKSEIDFIKNNIVKSELIKYFDLNKVEWLKCHEYSCKTLVKTVCEMWNDGLESTSLIGEKIHLNKGAVSNYLKRGSLLGWCDYSVEKVKEMQLLNLHQKRKRRVVCLNTNEIFNSIQEASQKYKIADSKITAVCKGTQKTSGKHPTTGENLIWMYEEKVNFIYCIDRCKNCQKTIYYTSDDLYLYCNTLCQERDLINEDIIIDLYTNKKLTLKQISETINYSTRVISNALDKFNIPKRNLSEIKRKNNSQALNKSELEKMYLKENKTVKEIANIANVSNSTVSQWLKKYKIPTNNTRSECLTKEVRLAILAGMHPEEIRNYFDIDMCTYHEIKSYRRFPLILKEYKEDIKNIDEKLRKEFIASIKTKLIKGISLEEISEHSKVSRDSLSRWLKKYENISQNEIQKLLKENLTKNVIQLYENSNKNQREIASEFNVSESVVSNILNENNVKNRKQIRDGNIVKDFNKLRNTNIVAKLNNVSINTVIRTMKKYDPVTYEIYIKQAK